MYSFVAQQVVLLPAQARIDWDRIDNHFGVEVELLGAEARLNRG